MFIRPNTASGQPVLLSQSPKHGMHGAGNKKGLGLVLRTLPLTCHIRVGIIAHIECFPARCRCCLSGIWMHDLVNAFADVAAEMSKMCCIRPQSAAIMLLT